LSQTFFAVPKLLNQFHHDRELSPEEGVLVHVHLVSVHLQQVQVHSRDGLDETIKGGGDLELLEEAGHDAASGGS
jgi:hypothetical protein